MGVFQYPQELALPVIHTRKVEASRGIVFAYYSKLVFIHSLLIFVRLFLGCSRSYLFSYQSGWYTSFSEINHSNRSTSSAASDSVTELTHVYKYWWWTIYKTSVRFISRDNCLGDKKTRKGVSRQFQGALEYENLIGFWFILYSIHNNLQLLRN